MTATLVKDRSLQLSTDTRLGILRLRVTELERALPIWRDMVGLHLVGIEGNVAKLGIGDQVMIELEASAKGPVPPHSLGFYHIAIHVPARKELARAIARQLQAGVRTSPTDHLVSEATYLWDMDGNGIEMTFETPERGSYRDNDADITFVTADGKPHSGREPIDLHDLFAELSPDDDLMAPLPEGTRLGHIHLHVRALDESMDFYADTIGFQRQILSKRFGMGDVRTNYEPHILAFNIWSGPNAQQPPKDAAGLTSHEIVLASQSDLDGVVTRLESAGHGFERLSNSEIALADPSGNPMRILVG